MAHMLGLATSDNAAFSIALAPGMAPNANTFQPVKSSEPAHARQNAETAANAVAASACLMFKKYPASSGTAGAKPNAPAKTAVAPTFAHACQRAPPSASHATPASASASAKNGDPASASATTSAPTANAAPAPGHASAAATATPTTPQNAGSMRPAIVMHAGMFAAASNAANPHTTAAHKRATSAFMRGAMRSNMLKPAYAPPRPGKKADAAPPSSSKPAPSSHASPTNTASSRAPRRASPICGSMASANSSTESNRSSRSIASAPNSASSISSFKSSRTIDGTNTSACSIARSAASSPGARNGFSPTSIS